MNIKLNNIENKINSSIKKDYKEPLFFAFLTVLLVSYMIISNNPNITVNQAQRLKEKVEILSKYKEISKNKIYADLKKEFKYYKIEQLSEKKYNKIIDKINEMLEE